MVPSLPFVLINGKTDLPRVGNKNMTGKLKKREREKGEGGKKAKEHVRVNTSVYGRKWKQRTV